MKKNEHMHIYKSFFDLLSHCGWIFWTKHTEIGSGSGNKLKIQMY